MSAPSFGLWHSCLRHSLEYRLVTVSFSVDARKDEPGLACDAINCDRDTWRAGQFNIVADWSTSASLSDNTCVGGANNTFGEIQLTSHFECWAEVTAAGRLKAW